MYVFQSEIIFIKNVELNGRTTGKVVPLLN